MTRTPILTTVLVATAFLAGCGAPPQESGPGSRNDAPPSCGDYVTAHFERAPEQAKLQGAFQDAGYTWDARTDRIADATRPGAQLTLSHRPGASGEDLVLSALGPDASEAASEAADLVNRTGENVSIKEWIAGNNCPATNVP